MLTVGALIQMAMEHLVKGGNIQDEVSMSILTENGDYAFPICESSTHKNCKLELEVDVDCVGGTKEFKKIIK